MAEEIKRQKELERVKKDIEKDKGQSVLLDNTSNFFTQQKEKITCTK